MKFLGDTGNKIMMRLMGLIMMVIAVEFFFSGLTPILQGIFDIKPWGSSPLVFDKFTISENFQVLFKLDLNHEVMASMFNVIG